MSTPRFREQLNQAERAYSNDEFETAVSLLRGAIRGRGDEQTRAHTVLGHSLVRLSRFDEAFESLRRGADDRETELAIVLCLLRMGRIADAREAVGPLRGGRDAMSFAAEIELADGDADAALALLAGTDDDAKLSIYRAQALMTLGRADEAATLLAPHAEDSALGAREQRWLRSVLADALDSLGRYDDAFGWYRRANETGKPAYDRLEVARYHAEVVEGWSAGALAGVPTPKATSDQPVFIVGMPRSGTTLVERLLAAHPDVHGAGELQTVQLMVTEFERSQRSWLAHAVGKLDRATVTRMAGRYLTELHTQGGRSARVTDKQPVNFQHLGLISRLLPGARVIHCVRDARDTCLSCYFRTFDTGYPWTYDLRWIGAYYNDYARIMAHWQRMLPETGFEFATVQYENLVANPREESARLFAFLGIDAVDVRLSDAANVKRTLRADQRDGRIYNSSVGKWTRYEAHIGPLLDELSLGSS